MRSLSAIASPLLGAAALHAMAKAGAFTDRGIFVAVDADGVALAAIQGLNQKLEEKMAGQAAELKAREDKLRSLRAELASLRELVEQAMRASSGESFQKTTTN